MNELLPWIPIYLLAWLSIWVWGRHVARAWAREELKRKARND